MKGPRESDAAGDASPADADGSPSSGLQFFLVRLIPAGTVCWVGSIHRLRHPGTDDPIRRGDRVVIQNIHGEWLAEVLNPVAPTDPPADGASGELLRVAAAEDEQAGRRSLRKAGDLFQATLRDRIASDATIVATEVSLDCRVGIIRMLGAADDRFGPAAVRLASDLELQRVQWIDVCEDRRVDAKPPPATSSEATPAEYTPEEAEESAFWQRMRQVVGEAVSLGATHRVAAGNRGLYQQKYRARDRSSPGAGAIETEPTALAAGLDVTGNTPLRPEASAYGSQQSRSSSAQPSPQRRSASAGVDRAWMIRVRTAAGGITAKQLERLCGIARRFGDGSIRLTTRQSLQLHGVALESAPEVMRQLQDAVLRTAGSCGNTVRNLTCCALPPRSAAERHLRELAARLARDSLPVGPAFECEPEWLDSRSDPGLPAGFDRPTDDVDELAGPSLRSPVLPHKWKIGLAVAGHNCVDVLNNDLALVLRRDSGLGETERLLVDVFVGGSTAYQPNRTGSTPRLASWLGAISRAEITGLLAALMELFQTRVLGERRHFRRWKYVVDRLGIEAIRGELRSGWGIGFQGHPDQEPPSAEALRVVDHPVENLHSDGRVAFCIPASGGRICCDGEVEMALRHLARLPITMRVASQHRLVVADVRHQDLRTVRQSLGTIVQSSSAGLQKASEALLGDKAFSVASPLPPIGNALACPALPTCPLAVDEAERVLPVWWQVVREIAFERDLPVPRFAISGCGNGCSRPLTTEIGVVAEKRGKRRVFFGGNGSRLGRSVGIVENLADFRSLLASWMSRYAASRRENEDFGDWFFRSLK
ncbi:MAG: hypothetical protein WD119_00400 [Pirellulaceae bacterium]